MKLVRRLTLSILLAIGVVFATNAFLDVRSHLALFEADRKRAEHVLGRALGQSVESAWRTQGEAYAREVAATGVWASEADAPIS